MSFILILFEAGCDDIKQQLQPEKNDCPAQVVSAPSTEHSGIEWTPGKVSAQIGTVLTECIPHRISATEKVAASTEYEIAVTARINYVLDKDEYRTFEARLIFEAMTANGVVIKSNNSSFRLVRGGNSGTASAVITALSREEVARVKRIVVRWEYGR